MKTFIYSVKYLQVKEFVANKFDSLRAIQDAIFTHTAANGLELQFQQCHRSREEGGITVPGGKSQKDVKELCADASLASELNNFNAIFEAISSQQAKTDRSQVTGWVLAPSTFITLSEHDIRRPFKHVTKKKPQQHQYQWVNPHH